MQVALYRYVEYNRAPASPVLLTSFIYPHALLDRDLV